MQRAFYTTGCLAFLLVIASQLGSVLPAGIITKPFTFSGGSVITASQFNSNFDLLYTEFNGAISAANLATDAVTTVKIADSQVTSAKILDGTIATADVADSAVTFAKMVSASAASKLVGRGSASGAGVLQEIAPDASTVEINGTNLRVKASGITANELSSNAVTTVKILDANVTAAKLASDAVTTVKILDQNVTLAKIVNASAASRLMIRGSAAGAGVWQEGTLDGSTVEFNGTAIRVKASGITSNELGSNSVTTVKITDANVTDAKLAAVSVVPVGTVFDYAGSSTPSGWLLCDGSAVNRTTYALLFTAIGVTYGAGDGVTTFNLPDCRGRLIAGRDDMGGAAASRITNGVCGITGTTLGAAGGDQNMMAHTHTMGSSLGVTLGGGGSCVRTDAGAANPTGSTGSGSTQGNVQPTIIMNKIIKAGV